MYTYRNFFNGAGVAIGDINNDGLPDIFFCSNQQSNKLYLNKGNFIFEDITLKAGLASKNVWSTGVTLSDVNGDGWLDIYVCKSGDTTGARRSNELFINNGNGTFAEKAKEYGLDIKGLSTHAAFFDYDKDGDLDCYLLCNSFKSVGRYDIVPGQRKIPDRLGGNKFFRNDGNKFVDITLTAGIYSSNIGFGLGITVADINKDGWQDIYVSNDFFEKDYLYINTKKGSFEESLEKYIGEISMNAMGADIADINNDGYPEIYVTDMLPEDDARIKTNTVFENWNKYQSNISGGYFKQFVRNTLQLNSGNMSFSEIGRYSGVSATDWSWGALITDLDNDGLKDIYVANGIYKDITDQDYIHFTANEAVIRERILRKEKDIIKSLVDLIPSHPVSNYAFANNGNLSFTNRAAEWGLDEPSFSNGSAYGDLDNDGDLDLVVNNVNMPSFVYRNQSREQNTGNNYVKISLAGEGKNRYGIGAKVTVYYNGTLAYQEQMPVRGFESTVDSRLNFGLGKATKIDSIEVMWNDGKKSLMKNITTNQHITVWQKDALSFTANIAPWPKPIFQQVNEPWLTFHHQENEYSDFDRDLLSYQMLSTQGPRIAKGDVNKDGLDDIYFCGAKGQAGALFIQQHNGHFISSNKELFAKDKESEDTDALFFDADGDADQDIYVCSGGNEYSANSTDLIDRLYLNDGKGKFTKSPQVLPSYIFENSSCVRSADYDHDGDQDLFIGVRAKPLQYGVNCKGYILNNNGKGIFTDATQQVCPALLLAGMVTDAGWIDYDKDGNTDLIITGEYMPVRIFKNTGTGKLQETTSQLGLSKTNGWWNRLQIADINQDGFPDLVCGNHGLNSKFKATQNKPIQLYVGDIDQNGSMEQILTVYNKDTAYPMHLRHDLVNVIPSLKKKYLKYEQYKNQTIKDILTPQQLTSCQVQEAYTMASTVFINNGGKGFIAKPLPAAAQLSSVYGISIADYDTDGMPDILLGGNFYECKPEAGIYDASYGLLLKGNGKGSFTALSPKQSGIRITGAVRDMAILQKGKKKIVIVARNNDTVQLLQF